MARRSDGLTLTPDALRAAYNFLNETAPFNCWNLPDGDDVQFRVVRDRSIFGKHVYDGETHEIVISGIMIGHTVTLMSVMAHEMIHVHERRSDCSATGHGAAFRRWADQVCRVHGFDPRSF